eukprot:c12404_g1_i2.p1 GENE.c12404_g1_i2~~c12404_g1_i2.p1  ORF type:complete len:943 (+),score=168.97 c12404_g1_i2:138-2831(+)
MEDTGTNKTEIEMVVCPPPDLTAAFALSKVRALKKFGGDAPEAQIHNAITKSVGGALIFGKSSCAYSIEARRTLEANGILHFVVLVNKEANHGAIRKILKSRTSIGTVPIIFINGKLIGDCNTLKTLESTGALMQLIATLDPASLAKSGELSANNSRGGLHAKAVSTLIAFPDTVNHYVVRATAFQSFIICVLIVIFRSYYWHWVIAALFGDFCLRFVAGPYLSPLGMFASLAASKFKPLFKAGPPKQFATFCGIVMSGLATLFYFIDIPVVGTILTAALGLATGFESIFDYCLGCTAFSIAIDYGLISTSIDKIHLNVREERKVAWETEFLLEHTTPIPEVVTVNVSSSPGQSCEADVRYKVKDSDFWKHQFHFIKYIHIPYFAAPLAISTLALTWKAAADASEFVSTTADLSYKAKRDISYILGLISAGIYAIFLAFYLAKIVMYTNKARKEWMDPGKGPAFTLLTIGLMIYAVLVQDESKKFAKVLIWIGAPLHMLITCLKLATFLTYRYDDGNMQNSWMLLPVGNMIAGTALAWISPEYIEPGLYFWGSGFVLWIGLFPLLLRRSVVGHNSDDRERAQIATWILGPLCGSLGYNILHHGDLTAFDIFSKSLMFFGITLTFVLCFATRPFRFLMREKFQMSYWSFAFPANFVAFLWILYDVHQDTPFTHVIAVIFFVAACLCTSLLFLHTLCALCARHIFRPEMKWGPLTAFNRFIHCGIRASLNKLDQNLAALETNPSFPIARDEFERVWRLLHLTHVEHSKHEDEYVFVAVKQILPHQSQHSEEEHVRDRLVMQELEMLISRLRNSDSDSDLRDTIVDLRKQFDAFHTSLLKHLDWEESHLQPIARKYFPVAMQIEIIKDLWESTNSEVWREIVPFIVTMIPVRDFFLCCYA